MRRYFEQLEARHGLDRLTKQSRQAVIGSYLALLILLVYGGLSMQDIDEGGLTPILLRVLPLVLFLPSILGRRPRGHAWLSFVSLLYFMQGVMVATLPGLSWLGMLESLAAIALFIGSMCYARFRSRQLRTKGTL